MSMQMRVPIAGKQGQAGSITIVVAGEMSLDRLFALPANIQVDDQTFAVEEEEGHIFLTHRLWSLVGVGTSLVAARQNLCDEARELADRMRTKDRPALTDEAWAMREFALRVERGLQMF